mmetsp:Transcript_7016/g.6200  ORF Transcript_7016/g.6200 Transcript_7016/m.6200 type:complete len:96 (+) Transcript_7016:125-412(+)
MKGYLTKEEEEVLIQNLLILTNPYKMSKLQEVHCLIINLKNQDKRRNTSKLNNPTILREYSSNLDLDLSYNDDKSLSSIAEKHNEYSNKYGNTDG